MSYVAEIDIYPHQWQLFRKELKTLPANAAISGKLAINAIATQFYFNVKKRYATIQAPALKESTKERRRYGTPSYAGIKPLSRSGQLISLVEKKMKTTGKTFTANVRIKPHIRMASGGISDRIAMMNEYGREMHSITITSDMIAYLHALLRKSDRYDEVMKKGRKSRGPKIIMNIPERPVWVPALLATNAKQPRDFAVKFIRNLNMRCKFLHFKLM